MKHDVTFDKNENTNWYRVRCSCGFAWLSDSLTECQFRASVHDREWKPIDANGKILKEAS